MPAQQTPVRPTASPPAEIRFLVRPVTSNEDAIWDALVDASSTGNRFLRSDCLRMLEETDSLGIRFARLGAFDASGALRAGWALPCTQRYGIHASTYFEFFYAGPMVVPELEDGSVHVCQERLQVLHSLAKEHARHLHLIEAEGHVLLQDARGVQYAPGWHLRTCYTHIWDFADPATLLARMTRENRRMIRRAGERYTFAPLDAKEAAAEFIPMYRQLMRKFNWRPTAVWDQDLKRRLEWLLEMDAGCVYAARNAAGEVCAAVILLLSRTDRTVYFWRCGYKQDKNIQTVVPGLYWHAALHIREQWGSPLFANLGGAPQMSLSQFKDYLGAKAVPHLKLIYHATGLRSPLWRCARWLRNELRTGVTQAGTVLTDLASSS